MLYCDILTLNVKATHQEYILQICVLYLLSTILKVIFLLPVSAFSTFIVSTFTVTFLHSTVKLPINNKYCRSVHFIY